MSKKTKKDVRAKRAADDERRRKIGLIPTHKGPPAKVAPILKSAYPPGIVLLTNPTSTRLVRRRSGLIVIAPPGRGSPAATPEREPNG